MKNIEDQFEKIMRKALAVVQQDGKRRMQENRGVKRISWCFNEYVSRVSTNLEDKNKATEMGFVSYKPQFSTFIEPSPTYVFCISFENPTNIFKNGGLLPLLINKEATEKPSLHNKIFEEASTNGMHEYFAFFSALALGMAKKLILEKRFDDASLYLNEAFFLIGCSQDAKVSLSWRKITQKDLQSEHSKKKNDKYLELANIAFEKYKEIHAKKPYKSTKQASKCQTLQNHVLEKSSERGRPLSKSNIEKWLYDKLLKSQKKQKKQK